MRLASTPCRRRIVDAGIGEGDAAAAAVLLGELQIHRAAADTDIVAVISIQHDTAARTGGGPSIVELLTLAWTESVMSMMLAAPAPV